MIYTVTFNPALDYVVRMKELTLGQVNRTQHEEIYPGGKGINVSVVLKNLGFGSRALGFTAGFIGKQIQRMVEAFGCETDFIDIPNGLSRINVKMKAEKETEINGQGPEITQNDICILYEKLEQLRGDDILVLAGSIPNTLPADIYEIILKRLSDKKIRSVVDATGDLLLNVLKYRPFLIKPNNHELGEIFDTELYSKDEIVFYAKKLQQLGARNVLISMAGEGAVLLDETGGVHHSLPPEGKVVNSVGAGDSMVAGFLAGYLEKQDYEYAFQMGLCTGSASAFSEWLAVREDVLKLMKKYEKEREEKS